VRPQPTNIELVVEQSSSLITLSRTWILVIWSCTVTSPSRAVQSCGTSRPCGPELMHHSAMRCPEQQCHSTCRHEFILTIPYNASLHHRWMLLHATAWAVIFIFYHSDHISTLFRPLSRLACCYKEHIPPVKEANFGSFATRKMCSCGRFGLAHMPKVCEQCQNQKNRNSEFWKFKLIPGIFKK
jgi:hypothetical protein